MRCQEIALKNALLRGFPASFLTIPSPGKKAGMDSSGVTQHGAALELPGLSWHLQAKQEREGQYLGTWEEQAAVLAAALTQLTVWADICKLPYTFVNVLVCLSKPISGINFVLFGRQDREPGEREESKWITSMTPGGVCSAG